VLKRFSLVFLLPAGMWAQVEARSVLRGELQLDGIDVSHDYQVELVDCTGGGSPIRAWLTSGNRFEFQDVAAGCKVLRVVSGAQRVVVQETQLFAERSGVPLVIRIAKPDKEPVKAATVSIERLRHPAPEKIARLIGESNRLWQAGRVAEAGEKLRPAVEKYPDIWELQLNLGTIEMKLGNVGAAAEHFSKARELDRHSPLAAVSSGFALLQLNRLEEAEVAAKDAVALEPGNRIARLLLERIQTAKRHAAD
jgi:Tetratricopeptide repeat